MTDDSATGAGVVEATSRMLREQVLNGAFASDSPVTEAWVSETFGIARPSAKAAIEQLVATGLLVRSAHRSARVAAIDEHMVRDIYGTRARLESVALRELAGARLAPPAVLSANAEIAAMPALPDPATVDPDLRFHTALIDAIASERTSRMYRTLIDEARLCMAQVQGRRLLDARTIATQHAAILDAIRNGDADQAVRLLDEHLDSAAQRLTEALRN